MTRKQIHDLLDITLDVNGLGERRREKTGTKPTAFFQFNGHVATVTAQFIENGWEPYAPYDIDMEFKTGKPCLQSEIDYLRAMTCAEPAHKEVDPQAVAYLETMIERYNEAKQAAEFSDSPDIRERFELVASTIKNLIDETYGKDAYVMCLGGGIFRVRGGEHGTD